MQLKSKETSSKSLDTLTAFLARLVAQRIEIHRKARLVEADLKAAELTEMNEHAALASIKEASGWGGGNGVNPSVANAAKRWQMAADQASTLRASLADMREREQSLTARIEAPDREATVRNSLRLGEERLGVLAVNAEAYTARATEMRARLAEIENQIEVLTATAAETAAATGKIVSPPSLAQLQSEAAIARAAEGSATRKAAQIEADRQILSVELNDIRHDLRFAIRAATAVVAEAALEPIKMDLARAAVANSETTFTVRFDPAELDSARSLIHGE